MHTIVLLARDGRQLTLLIGWAALCSYTKGYALSKILYCVVCLHGQTYLLIKGEISCLAFIMGEED